MNKRQSDYFSSVREKYNICHKCSSFRDYKKSGLCIQCDKEEIKKNMKTFYERQNKILKDKQKEVINRYNQSESSSEIARDLGIAVERLTRFLKKNDVKIRSSKETYRLKKIKELGFKVSPFEARKFLISELNLLKGLDNQFVEEQIKIIENLDDLSCLDRFIERMKSIGKL